MDKFSWSIVDLPLWMLIPLDQLCLVTQSLPHFIKFSLWWWVQVSWGDRQCHTEPWSHQSLEMQPHLAVLSARGIWSRATGFCTGRSQRKNTGLAPTEQTTHKHLGSGAGGGFHIKKEGLCQPNLGVWRKCDFIRKPHTTASDILPFLLRKADKRKKI